MAEFESSETGNWNLSSPYVQQLATLFLEANVYKEIARFGFTDIILDLQTKEVDKTILRYRGFEKYIYKLKDIIIHSYVAFDKSNLKEKFVEFKKDLEEIEDNCLKTIIKQTQNGMKTKKEIDEDMFKLIFKKVEDMDMKMRAPMKAVDLIFMNKETFDAVEFKKRIADSFKEGM